MIKVIKSNKVFSLCLIVTVLVFISGIFFYSLIDEAVKTTISENVGMVVDGFSDYKVSFSSLFVNVFNSSLFMFVIWVLGISVIGSILLLVLYLIKVFVFGFELVSLFSILGIKNILFIILYLISDFLYLAVLFLIVYYGISFSVILFKVLFFKKNINLNEIMTRYLKILLFCLICELGIGLLEVFLIPNIIAILI